MITALIICLACVAACLALLVVVYAYQYAQEKKHSYRLDCDVVAVMQHNRDLQARIVELESEIALLRKNDDDF